MKILLSSSKWVWYKKGNTSLITGLMSFFDHRYPFSLIHASPLATLYLCFHQSLVFKYCLSSLVHTSKKGCKFYSFKFMSNILPAKVSWTCDGVEVIELMLHSCCLWVFPIGKLSYHCSWRNIILKEMLNITLTWHFIKTNRRTLRFWEANTKDLNR